MDPDSIAEENEKKRNEANSANPSTSLSPEQGGTQLSGTAAPAPVTPTTSTASQSAPTKTGATTQANIGGFQQANQAKIAALGNITNQRLQERVGAANQAIAGQKAARVEDVNAQTYAGPKTASLEDLGANESLQTTLAGAGRKSDITNAAKQVAGFGAYDELKNLANNAGSKAYAGNLGLTGGSTDNLLSRSNAATQQGLREQTKGVQNTLKAEQVGALNSVKAAGENVNKANEASVKEIDTNLTNEYNTQKDLAFKAYDEKVAQSLDQAQRGAIAKWKADYRQSILDGIRSPESATPANFEDLSPIEQAAWGWGEAPSALTAQQLDQLVNRAYESQAFNYGGLGRYNDPGQAEAAKRIGFVPGTVDQSESTKLRELSANQQKGINALQRIMKSGLVTPDLGGPQSATTFDQLKQLVGANLGNVRGQASAATIAAAKKQGHQNWQDMLTARKSESPLPASYYNEGVTTFL